MNLELHRIIPNPVNPSIVQILIQTNRNATGAAKIPSPSGEGQDKVNRYKKALPPDSYELPFAISTKLL